MPQSVVTRDPKQNIKKAVQIWLPGGLWEPDPVILVAPKSETVSLLTRCPLCCAVMAHNGAGLECPGCGTVAEW